MARGKVKRFDEKKGYGFVEQDSGGQDVFIHYSDITGDGYRTLAPGDVVEYDLVQGDKGLKAINVRKVNE